METQLNSQKQIHEKPLLLSRDKNIITIFNRKLNKSLRFDLIKMTMEKYYEREKKWQPVIHQYEFFRNFSISDIDCPEEKFLRMIQQTKKLNPNCTSVSSFIGRMRDSLIYENYNDEGIKTQCNVQRSWGSRGYYKEILTKPLDFYNRNIIKFFKKFNIEVTIVLERYFINDYKLMESIVNEILNEKYDIEYVRELIVDITHGSFSDYGTLVNQYKYEPKALIGFILGYLKPFENLGVRESLQLLRDYYSMANGIGRNVKKYPKYLKSMHDIITANYNSFKKKYDEKLFENLMKPELEFEGKEFCIIIPRNSKELVREGTSNCNCVSSYVDRILRNETYLMFLRKTDNKENSLVTLEYQNNSIIQAKGSYNRPVSKEEQEFLVLYCKNKNIKLKI